jgi:hypothetical protein
VVSGLSGRRRGDIRGDLEKQPDRTFLSAVGLYIRASTGLEILLAFLVVVPLTLWFAWAQESTTMQSVIETLFCLSFAWGSVATLQWFRNFQRLGESSSTRLLLGPRPEDPDELHAWRWGRQCHTPHPASKTPLFPPLPGADNRQRKVPSYRPLSCPTCSRDRGGRGAILNRSRSGPARVGRALVVVDHKTARGI